MSSLSRLGLGTAQFGAHYGVSNREGRPSEAEIAAILACAVDLGFGYVDTAPSYGEAEVLVGRHLPRHHKLRIVSKTLPVAGSIIGRQEAQAIVDAIASSCERLRVGSLYGVLVHHPSDLRKPGWEYLVEALHEVQARGLADRIGVSVYDADDLALIESRFRPDLAQLPYNILDQRLSASGWLDKLKSTGSEIHARSIFLQGLLLMAPSAMPAFFAPIRERIEDLQRQWSTQGISPLAGCLAFALDHANIDAAILGANSPSELAEIATVVSGIAECEHELEIDTTIDPRFVDPRQWPRFDQQPVCSTGDRP